MFRIYFSDQTFADVAVDSLETTEEFLKGKVGDDVVVTWRIGFVDGWHDLAALPTIVKKPIAQIPADDNNPA